MSAPTTHGPGVHITFELQYDQVSGADTETYHAEGNQHDVEPSERRAPYV